VCKLKKDLYGLKQAPRAWYARIDSYLWGLGISKSIADPNLYIKVVQNQTLILALYVDDLFLLGVEHLIDECKREPAYEFEMKYLGLLHYFLVLEVQQKTSEIFLSQRKYVQDILSKFRMTDCKPMVTLMVTNLKKLHDAVIGSDPVDLTQYQQLIGSLLYLVHTRPDICYAVSALSQFMSSSKHIKGTQDYGLRYTLGGGVLLHGFFDSNWARSVQNRKSTSRFCFSMGSAMVFWLSRKQGLVTLSTTEAEYVSASDASREDVCLWKLLSDFFDTSLELVVIHCDNQSCIKISENLVFHDRSKHMEMRYHYLRDMVQ
jgi:hypothetical protein